MYYVGMFTKGQPLSIIGPVLGLSCCSTSLVQLATSRRFNLWICQSNVQKIAFWRITSPEVESPLSQRTCEATAAQYPRPAQFDYRHDRSRRDTHYPPEVRFEIPEQDISAYRRAADF
jgi:hypothetical protein